MKTSISIKNPFVLAFGLPALLFVVTIVPALIAKSQRTTLQYNPVVSTDGSGCFSVSGGKLVRRAEDTTSIQYPSYSMCQSATMTIIDVEEGIQETVSVEGLGSRAFTAGLTAPDGSEFRVYSPTSGGGSWLFDMPSRSSGLTIVKDGKNYPIPSGSAYYYFGSTNQVLGWVKR